MFVAKLFVDLERLEVPALGSCKVALLVGNRAQLVVSAGRAVLVAKLFSDLERLEVPILGSLRAAAKKSGKSGGLRIG